MKLLQKLLLLSIMIINCITTISIAVESTDNAGVDTTVYGYEPTPTPQAPSSEYISLKDNAPEISSPAAILVDNYTNTIIYGKNIDQKMYPASTTKILTAILAIENTQPNDKATASYDAIMSLPSGYSIGDIKVGESLTIQQLLEVLLVHSANDAANVLAEHIGGSIESFASMMNTKAAEIGCKNSHFVNPSGKHDDNHYTTARDMALIMQYCMKNSAFRYLSSLRSCSLPATDFAPKRDFSTTVELLIPDTAQTPNKYYYPYAIAGKTGFTTEAQNCLVSVAKKDNVEFTSVILGSGKNPDGSSARFNETKQIYDYGFDNFKIDNIGNAGDVIDSIEISNASPETKNLDLILKEDIKALSSKNQDLKNIKPTITLNKNLKAPIAENQIMGTIEYKINDISYKTDILASHNVEKSKYTDLFIKVGIIVAVAFVIIIIILLLKGSSNKGIYKIK